MARSRSPGYPNFGLQEAVSRVSKVFQSDRRSALDREVVARHIGYSGISGAADKAMATLGHFGLLERVGKGELRVSQLAVDILAPESAATKKAALIEAAFRPDLFAELRERFAGGKMSEEALRSYLVRNGYQNAAIEPAVKSYLSTSQFLELERAYESHGAPADDRQESDRRDVEAPAAPPAGQAAPPASPAKKEIAMEAQERVLKTGMLSKGSSFRLIVEGQIGVKEIDRLIKQLELDKEMLADQDDEDDKAKKNVFD